MAKRTTEALSSLDLRVWALDRDSAYTATDLARVLWPDAPESQISNLSRRVIRSRRRLAGSLPAPDRAQLAALVAAMLTDLIARAYTEGETALVCRVADTMHRVIGLEAQPDLMDRLGSLHDHLRALAGRRPEALT